jgi:hypothetical protein
MGGKAAALLIAAGILWAGVAHGGLPDPAFSDVPNVLMSPNATLTYTVMVGSQDGPVAGAVVEIQFSAEAMTLGCWCQGQPNDVVQGVTDGAGEVSFNIAGGGCLNPAFLTEAPAAVYADGRLLAEVGVVNVDAVDGSALFPWQGWNPGSMCAAGTSDAIFHTGPFSTAAYEYCSDLDSNGVVSLGDSILATPGLAGGAACNSQ